MSAPQESNLLSKGAALPLLQSEPSPAERAQTEHAVRTAATVAAQLEDGSLPRAVLDYIVATSDFRQNRQALEARAASIANHVVHDVKAPNWSGAHPTEVAAYLASLGKQFGDYRRHVALQGAAEANGADRDSIRASFVIDPSVTLRRSAFATSVRMMSGAISSAAVANTLRA